MLELKMTLCNSSLTGWDIYYVAVIEYRYTFRWSMIAWYLHEGRAVRSQPWRRITSQVQHGAGTSQV